jgi:hypothetical protein
MVISTAKGPDGDELYVLGITRANVERLLLGHPINVSAESHIGFPLQRTIVICYGETEQVIGEAMAELVGPDTKIVVQPRQPKRVS